MDTLILVIEDNEQNMYLITYLLEKHGYRVIQAANGREGIEMVSFHKPSMVILDIQLPDMDGYTIARELKANPDFESVPIVAVTSYAMVGDRERAIKAGCAGYIEKPINPDTFVAQIEKHFQGGSNGERGET